MISGIVWILIASMLGFTVASVFAGLFRLRRNVYLLFYIPLVASLFVVFILSNDINIKEIVLHNWAWGLLGLSASFFATTAYHLGYPEFRGKKVIWPNIGNGVLSLAYLLTMNPLAAILPHITMHIAAMIHGPKTTGQVPPHYDDSIK